MDDTTPLVAEAVREDFAYLYRTLQEAHYDLYAHRSRGAYDAHYRALRAQIRGPMTRVQMAELFQRFVAYGRIGHARIDAPIQAFVADLRAGGKLVPLFIRVDGKRVLLTAPAEDSGTLLAGTQLLAVNGTPVRELIRKLGVWVSSERQWMTDAQMEQSFPALLWLALGPVDGVQVTARVGAHTVRMRVAALTLEQRRALNERFPTLRPATDFNAREYRPPAQGIAYLRPGPFFDTGKPTVDGAPSYDVSGFRQFVDQSFANLVSANATDLLLDLRNNPGGDNSFSDPMIAWFARRPFRFASSFRLKASAATKAAYTRQRAAGPVEPDLARMMEIEERTANGTRYDYELPLTQPHAEPRFHGHVWVLIDRHSYSNAASVAALIQDYGFGTILGEETADVASNYASVQSFELPASGIVVTYPKSHFIRPDGRDEVAGVKPDVPLPRQPIGVASDAVLDAALEHIRAAPRIGTQSR